jgi:hypothetical protein
MDGRSKVLRITTQKGRSALVLQRVLAYPSHLHQFRDFFLCTCSKQCIKLKAVYLSSRPFCEKIKRVCRDSVEYCWSGCGQADLPSAHAAGKEKDSTDASGHLLHGAHAYLAPVNYATPMSSCNWKRSKAQLTERVPATIAISCCFLLVPFILSNL